MMLLLRLIFLCIGLLPASLMAEDKADFSGVRSPFASNTAEAEPQVTAPAEPAEQDVVFGQFQQQKITGKLKLLGFLNKDDQICVLVQNGSLINCLIIGSSLQQLTLTKIAASFVVLTDESGAEQILNLPK